MPRRTDLRLVQVPNEASAEDAVEVAANWSNGVLRCRGGFNSHAWKDHDAVHNKKLKYWHVILRCPSCGTLKNIEMSEQGEIFAKWYNYQPGYLSKIGRMGPEARAALRMVSLKRLYSTRDLTGQDLKEDVPRSQNTRVITKSV